MNTKFFMRCQRNPILLPNVRIFFLYTEYRNTAHVYRNFSLSNVTYIQCSGHDHLYYLVLKKVRAKVLFKNTVEYLNLYEYVCKCFK